jgi:hypothetical protein
MILKFIGKDGSMGLRHGRKYSVSIETRGTFIVVSWTSEVGVGDKAKTQCCPYSSLQKLAENWQ